MTGTPTNSTRIAESLAAAHRGPEREVSGVSPLSAPRDGTLSFCSDPDAAADALRAALDAGAVVLVPNGGEPPAAGTSIAVENPRGAFALAVREYFAPRVTPGIHPTAVVDPSAQIAESARIGPFSVIGPDARIGEGVDVRNHVVVAAGVVVGDGCVLKSHAVIGEEGLGIDKDAAGDNVRIPHLGSVVLGEHVEVGSFSTVCSGTIVPTRVGAHTKIDDHAHVAHNVQLGENVIVVANAEIAGSVAVGDRSWIGPNSSVLNGMTIGSEAVVGIGAVVTRDVGDGETWFGNPARRVPGAAS